MKRLLSGCMMSAMLCSCVQDVSKYKKCNLGIRLEDTSATCDDAERDLRDVRAYLSVVGLDTAPPELVIFRATINFKCPNGHVGSGCTSLGLMQTNYLSSSLAHEMMHYREGSILVIGTSWHEGWISKGFNGLDMFWSWIVTQRVFLQIDQDFCGWYHDLRTDHAKLLKAAGYPVDEWRRVRTRARISKHCMTEL